MEFIIDLNYLKDEDLVHFKYKGRPAVLVKYKDKIKAYIDYCTHAGGPLCIEDGKLKCKTHYALFNIETGEAETLPAPKGSKLMEIALKVEKGKVYHLNRIIFR